MEQIIENIRKAINITKEKYGINQARCALMNYIIYNDSTMFTRTGNARNIINNIPVADIIKTMQGLYPGKSLKEAIYAFVNETEISKNAEMQDIKIYPRNIERCKNTIMLGGILEHQEGDLGVDGGEIFISSRKGNRDKQQDAVIAIKHPDNPKFRLMVVADGMGGMESGEFASNMIIQEIKKWFENLDIEYYYQPDELKTRFMQIINEINNKMYLKLKEKGGSTFVGAIECQNDTIGASVGDSRAYSYSNGRIQKLAKDDSLTQELYKIGKIEQEDDMRFHKKSNIVTQYIGQKSLVIPNIFSLKNNQYSCLILASDGVTDCLSDKQIEKIIKHNKHNQLAKTIVEEALTNDSKIRKELAQNPNYYPIIKGGKDNATIAVLIPSTERKKGIRIKRNEESGREL